MDKEQILALAEEQGAVANLKQHFNMAGDSIVFTPEELEAFFNAAIESYKAELLKEVGEPVAWLYESKQGHRLVSEQRRTVHAYDSETPLFTSDQVATAILKATKLLEDQLAAAQEEIAKRQTQVEAGIQLAEAAQRRAARVQEQLAKAEQLWQVAQGRCDGLEEKLAKAEQRVAEYNELIYAVQTKHPDETRHQTALRYIRNAENRQSYTAANGASS